MSIFGIDDQQLTPLGCRCEISHPAPPPSKTDSGMTTNSPFSRNKHRRRKDSMSFATGDSSSSEEATSTSESESEPEKDDLVQYSSSVDSMTSGQRSGASTPRAIERQGSPWRESPLSVAMAAGEVRLRSKRSKLALFKREKTIQENGSEQNSVDRNSLYTKGAEEVPLPSRIERESQ